MVVDSSPTARTFSPAQTSRTPRRAPAHASTAFKCSFQARLYMDGKVDQSKRACLNAPSKLACSLFGRGLIDLLLRAWASTATLQIRLVWCARSASKGDQQPLRPRFLVCAFGEQRKHLAYPFAPSKLACILYMDGKVDQSKRARVYEHRVPTNTIVPVCAFREHKD